MFGVTCAGGHLQELVFSLLAYGSWGWNSGHQAWEQGTLPTELSHCPHWAPSLPLSNWKIKFSTSEGISSKGKHPSSAHLWNPRTASVIPGQCSLCTPCLCHTGPKPELCKPRRVDILKLAAAAAWRQQYFSAHRTQSCRSTGHQLQA